MMAFEAFANKEAGGCMGRRSRVEYSEIYYLPYSLHLVLSSEL